MLRRAVLAGLLGLGSLLAGAGSAGALTPPPADKAEIFFVNGGRILSIKADGTERKVLTRRNGSVSIFSKVSDSAPLASPDGQTVLFTRSVDDTPQKSGILAIDREGGTPKRILGPRNGQGEILSFSAVDWSADGSRFYAFRFWGIDRNESTSIKTELLSVKPDGSGIRKLYSTSVNLDPGKASASGRWIPFEASVTPNGKTALLAMTRFTPASKTRLARINLTTGKRTWLSKDAGPADIAPDGQTVVFSSEREKRNESCYDGYCSYQPKLYLVDIDGSNLRRLMPKSREGSFRSPDFSPDGNRIVFEADSATGRSWFGPEIWSLKIDGSCLTRLTNGSPRSGEPAWGAGSITGPGTCGQADLRPVVDVNYPKRAEKLKPRPMWLGQEHDNLLLSEVWTGHNSLVSRFADCGALDPEDCPAPVSVRSVQICGAGLGNELNNGTYGGIEKVRGGLVLNFNRPTPYGVGTSTHLVSGGLDVSIESERVAGPGRGAALWRRAAIDQLRFVGADSPPARFRQPVFAARTIRAARALLRNYRSLGSLKKAAIKTGLYGPRGSGRWQVTFAYERKGAVAWLRFAKDLKKAGPFRTVGCRGR